MFQNNEEQHNIKEMEEEKIIRVCYKIFLALLQTKVLDEYLAQFNIPPTKKPTLKNYSPLCCFLYKIRHSPNCLVPPNIFWKAIDEIAQTFHKKMDNLWEKLPSQVKSSYENAVKKNNEYFQAKQLQYVISQDQNEQKNLYRLNILSLFFKTNKDLMKLVKASKKKSMIKKRIIMAFLKMKEEEYDNYLQRYVSFTSELAYDYVEQFENLIILACLMDLKYRIGNFISNKKLKQQIPEPPYPVQFKGIRVFFESKENVDEFKYLFSQLVFSTNGDNYSKRNLILKSKVLKEMNEITLLSSYVERRSLFLHIKITNNISLHSLHAVYRSISTPNRLIKDDRPQNQLKHVLEKLEWIHAKDKNFPNSLKQIVFHTQSFKLMYDNHVIQALISKSVKRRYNLQQQILPCLLKAEVKQKKKQIFASLHQISYQDTKNYSYVNSNSTEASQKVTKDKIFQILILSTSKKLLACTLMQGMDTNDLYNIINYYFKKKSVKNVSLVLLENIVKPIVLSPYHNFMYHYFAKNFDARIYISNQHHQYSYHWAIFQYIKSLMINRTFFSYQSFQLILQEVFHRKIKTIGKRIRADNDNDLFYER